MDLHITDGAVFVGLKVTHDTCFTNWNTMRSIKLKQHSNIKNGYSYVCKIYVQPNTGILNVINFSIPSFVSVHIYFRELAWCSQYSNWLCAGELRHRSLSPSRGKIFLLSMSSRLALRSTQPTIQQIVRALSLGVQRLGHEADCSPPLPHTFSWHSASLVKQNNNFTLIFISLTVLSVLMSYNARVRLSLCLTN
jgi:hypothetical protein